MMRTRASAPRARAISTSCCSAMRREPASASGSTRGPDPRQERRRPHTPLPPVDAAPRPIRLQAEGQVLGDGQLGEQRGLLVDRGHAQAPRQQGIRAVERQAGDGDGTGVRTMGPRHDLDQRALAGAVLAHERVHLARAHVEIDAAERADGAERLGDAADLEERVHRHPA